MKLNILKQGAIHKVLQYWNKEFPDYIIFDNIKYSVGDDVVYTFNGKSAIIEEIIRDEYSRFFFKFKIKLKKNNKIKYASLDYIVRINLWD